MPSKEILREILETLNEAGIDHVAIEGIREWNGDNARNYSEALSWLNDKSLIETTEDDQLYDNKKHEFFSAKINSSGREFLENGCELKNEPVTIRIDDDQFKTLLLSIAESVGDKRDVFTLRSFFNRAGAAGVSAFMAESVKLGLSNLSVILSKF